MTNHSPRSTVMRSLIFALLLTLACSTTPTAPEPQFKPGGPNLQARFTVTCGGGPLPVQFECDFDGTASTGPIVLYLWNFDVSGGADPLPDPTGQVSHVYPAAGRYHVVLSVFDAAGNGASAVKQINVR